MDFVSWAFSFRTLTDDDINYGDVQRTQTNVKEWNGLIGMEWSTIGSGKQNSNSNKKIQKIVKSLLERLWEIMNVLFVLKMQMFYKV